MEEQIKLAQIIKNVHQELRDSTAELGVQKAWQNHLNDKVKLKLYGESMRELSENHWKIRNAVTDDRINWIVNSCNQYYQKNELETHRKKDIEIINKLKNEGSEIVINSHEDIIELSQKLKVLDVGSSGNFFRKNSRFDILALDIAPSDKEVLFCDFLSVNISDELKKDEEQVFSLSALYYDIVIFCLLLEYLPTSDLRIQCCQKAYDVLKTEGILLIVTPDSNSQHINYKQIKTWKYVLATMGFKRIKLEKLKNLSCMVFRKSLSKEISRRWADKCKEPFMSFKLEIPQDRKKNINEDIKHDSNENAEKYQFDLNLMKELPL